MNTKANIPSNLSDPVAEMALLGAILLDPTVVPQVLEIVPGPEILWDERHAAIYRAAMDCYAANPTADLVLIRARLEERGQLEEIGGDEYLRKLVSETPSAAAGVHYARVVAARYRARRLAEVMDTAARGQRAGVPVDELAESLSGELLSLTASQNGAEEVHLGKTARLVRESIRDKAAAYIPTGLLAFDKSFGGVPLVGVTTILGIPGAGKSALSLNIATTSALTQGLGWRIFSFEVGAQQITQNALSLVAQVPVTDIRRRQGEPADHEWAAIDKAVQDLEGCNIAVVEKNLTAEGIAARCARCAPAGARAFIIDYVQNVAPSYPEQSERERIAAVMRAAQETSRLYSACVIVISQPTLDACRQDRALRASDVKGGQEIFAGSDLILSVYRSAAVRPRQADEADRDWQARRSTAEIHVVKNKNGPTGMVEVQFKPEILRFSS